MFSCKKILKINTNYIKEEDFIIKKVIKAIAKN